MKKKSKNSTVKALAWIGGAVAALFLFRSRKQQSNTEDNLNIPAEPKDFEFTAEDIERIQEPQSEPAPEIEVPTEQRYGNFQPEPGEIDLDFMSMTSL